MAEAARAAEPGLDLVVTDHHLPLETLPAAAAVVDPARPDDESPFKALSGAGVAFKLCAALDGCAPEDLLDFAGDLAAIGTVADDAPGGENRTIVRHGLAALQNSERPGLLALLEACGLSEKPVTAENISFALAPASTRRAAWIPPLPRCSFCCARILKRAEQLTERLLAANTARQEAEQQIMAEAEAQLPPTPPARTTR